MGGRVSRLLFVGLPACAAIAAGFPLLGYFSLAGGPPLELVDWVVGGLCSVLALVALGFTARAALRAHRREASYAPFIAWFSPVLLLGGLGGGAYAAVSIHDGLVEGLESGVRSTWCERPELVGHRDQPSCEQAAVDCLHLAWEGATLDAGVAEALLATLTTRRQQLEREATLRSKTDGYYDGGEVRVLDRLRDSLRVDAHRPRDTQVRQAGLACLVTRGS